MGQHHSKGAAAYSRPLIQGLPDALPNFEIKLQKPQETQALAFPALDWECLDKPLHISGKEMQPKPTAGLKEWRPLPNPFVHGALTATFPKMLNPHNKKMEWMRHPLADTWFFEVTDTCAFGGMWDGNGGDMKGWSAAHLAMLQTRSIIWNELRHHKLKSSISVAKVLENALMASHDQIIRVDEAQSTTALLFFLVQIDESRCGMVYAALGDVELYCYSQFKGGWMSLMQPFTDLRFKDFGQLKSGMNLQYGAVLLAPDDVIVAATDGLGDVLDPIAANVPPKEFGLKFADWQQFAKQHALDGPTTLQELKVERMQQLLGNLSDTVQPEDVPALVDKLVQFTMMSTAGERELYSDAKNRNENGRVFTDKVEKKRAAGLAAGNYTFAKMDHVGILAFSPRCLTVPRPSSGVSPPPKEGERGHLVRSSSVSDQLKSLGEKFAGSFTVLGRKSKTPSATGLA